MTDGIAVEALDGVEQAAAPGGRRKPYPAYKDSGVEWLGEIPALWTVKRLKHVFHVINGSTPVSGEPAYWDGEIPWVTPEDLGDESGTTIMATRRNITDAGYRSCGTTLVPAGSLVLSTRAPIGHLAMAGVDLCTNQGCRSLLFRTEASRQFFFYQLLAARPRLESLGQGSTFRELARGMLEDVELVEPPESEQRAIAAYLDGETARIDKLLAKKERLIELLQEKRTAVIARGVTRGLDATVPMKDSGIADLGLIPAHWRMLRNATLFIERDERGFQELPILHVSINTGVTVREFSSDHIEQQMADRAAYKRAIAGDLVFNKMRMWQGAVGVAPVDGLVSPDYTVARPSRQVEPSYFEHLLRTPVYKAEVDRHSYGMVRDRNRIYWDAFKTIQVPTPPRPEQRAIVDYLRSECGELERVQARIRQGIALLREYRAALIAATVSGKIDVREEAA